MAGSPLKRARRAALAAGGDPVAAGEEARARKTIQGGNPRISPTQQRIAEMAEANTRSQVPAVIEQAGDRPPTDKERAFVEFKALGMSDMQAARHAGYAFPKVDGAKIAAQPNVVAAIREQRAKYEEAGQMTKKRVLDGFLEAIEQGKLLTDPIAQIAGWREIAKLCGYYEPQKHEIALSVQGSLVVQKIQQLSDEELLKLAEGEVLEGEIVDRTDAEPG